MNREKAQRRFIFICLAPAVILATIFIFIPTINVFRMSLYRMGGITNKKSFVGFSNFVKLMDDKNFLEAMQNSILIIVMVMICTIVLVVLFAALLSRGNFKGKNFFRIIFYIPNILSIVVIAGIFGAIYNPSTGLLNTFLDAIHLSGLKHQWMGDPSIVIYSVIGHCIQHQYSPAEPDLRLHCRRRKHPGYSQQQAALLRHILNT